MRSTYIGLLSSVANIEGPIVIYLVVEGGALVKGGALAKGVRFAYALVYRGIAGSLVSLIEGVISIRRVFVTISIRVLYTPYILSTYSSLFRLLLLSLLSNLNRIS